MYIYTKRIDHKTLVVVQQSFNKCRVLLLLNGKRFDFADYKAASRKVWHITNSALGVESYSWTGWMAKSELEARINARLDRALENALVPKFGDPDFDIDAAYEADVDAQFERAFGDTYTNVLQPEYLDDSEERDIDNMANYGL